LARGWAISGISDQTREAAMAAADAAGMPVGAWVEQALRQALEAKAGAGPEKRQAGSR
jgi:predicted HicB family RNase H-like nuclease